MELIKSVIVSLSVLVSIIWTNNALSADQIKLYAIDCGSYDVADMKDLSSTGEYDGQKMKMANPCFLIRHPQGDLLWESGHIDS